MSEADEVARERIAVSSEEARRRANAEAVARQASFIEGGACGGGPPPSLQTIQPAAPAPPTAETDPAEERRIDAVVRPGFKSTFDGLTGEIIRLKRLSVLPADAPLRSAVTARIGELTAQWIVKTQSEGVIPPSVGFDPYTATDRGLRDAFLWTEVAGTIPLPAAMTDGGARYRDDLFEAVAVRTPGLDTLLLASYHDEPGAERALLERELIRLGDHSPCGVADTVEALRERRAALLRVVDEKQAAIDGKIRWIGLDGRQGTFEQLVDYELEQRWLAMNPGTTTGALTATASTALGGTTEEIRFAGEAGNNIQNIAGAFGGVGDPRRLGPPPSRPRISGRRREMPRGPGLGRRTRASGMTAAGRAPPTRLPASIADKHILNGEVNSRGEAKGFHHQAPGTEANARIVPGTQSAPDKYGVYAGTVDIKDPATGQWVRKDQRSTFFPRTWTRSEVRTAILEAFANRTDAGNGRWTGRLSNGMRVTGYLDEARRITSAYPVKEE